MSDKITPKKKGNSGWMKGFVIPKRLSEAERLDRERSAMLIAKKVKIIQSNRNR